VLYAVVGDIHANLHALNAVLDDISGAGADRLLCVGDIVGYGAYPRECIDRVREVGVVAVAGNHDWGVIGKVDIRYFNADARDSIEWTRAQMSDDHRQYLESLKLQTVTDDTTIVHSSLFAPDYFDYITTLYDVELSFKHQNTTVCFVGHSHVPVMFVDTAPPECFLQPEFQIPDGRKALINVGSVGQPRDFVSRASYSLYDSDERTVCMRRVDYDCQGASQDILNAGLPTTNATRLLLGR
jgi:diadenosine tetraphosphatase ApaH/serine/threonine PP2A family protein phosphatase